MLSTRLLLLSSTTHTISYSPNYLKTIPTMHSLLILILIYTANYISPRYKRPLIPLHVVHDTHRIRRNELFSRQQKKEKMPLARVTKELTQHGIALHLYNHLDPSSSAVQHPRLHYYKFNILQNKCWERGRNSCTLPGPGQIFIHFYGTSANLTFR